MEKLEIIKEKIKEPLKKLQMTVDEITYVKEGNVNSLNIILDKGTGIDLDAIVEATNIINPIIDELDLFEESYVLDVSSKERGEKNE